MKKHTIAIILAALLLSAWSVGCAKKSTGITLLNVSYDPTREFYKDYNDLFAAHWKTKTGQSIEVRQSHGGSGKQARSVIDGLEADVVTLALAYDVDAISRKGLTGKDWQKRLPDNSAPYTSTIVFVVRQGNPRQIKDWNDLVRDGVSVITPSPKTSGGARWNYLAARGYAMKTLGEDKARGFIEALYKNVPVLDSGARGATTTFAKNNQGDVLIAWENEALLIQKEFPASQFEVVTPSASILAEPSVSSIDTITAKHGTKDAADEYLRFLYTDEAQALAAKHGYRPRKNVPGIRSFPSVKLFTVEDTFGGWEKAQSRFFADGAEFDQVYRKK
ncbi:MAG: sulfate ABC transporter substrate-binding protein [Spirochaetia bacterium]|nr:sulfate ABC transporter substrate-binding protein [Spirochaetia bacterium]